MKFVVDQSTLLAALTKARSVIESRNTIPILSNVRVVASTDGTIAFRGSDLDMQVDTVIAGEVSSPGSTTVGASLAFDAIRYLPKGASVAFEEIEDGGRVSVRSGRSHFKLQALPAVDYPDLDAGEFSHRFTCSGETIAHLFARTQFAISTEETRYYLNGAFLHQMRSEGGEELRACTTDGHRLALAVRTSPPEDAIGFPGVIVPAKAISTLLPLAAGRAEVGIAVSRTKIRFDTGEAALLSKIIDGTFPDYQRVLPSGNDKSLRVDREQFVGAVTRCAVVGADRDRAIKLEMSEEDGLILSVNNMDKGSSKEEIDAEFEGAPLTIGLNARYLLSIAETMKSDNLVFRLADPGSPVLVMERDGALDRAVIMPLRV